MVTGSAPIPRTQADSHGAGQRRPVNSGKLLVSSNCSAASPHRPWKTRSLKTGMRLPRGQPCVQNGMPQSMHRAPWVCTSASLWGS